VLVNNASYGNVKRDQERLYEGRHSGAVLHNPDFQAYARSFGVPAWRVETADAFRGALREALAADSPAIVEVVSDINKDYPPYKFHQPRLP
jgi:acetolactate synthase I/II/III large subunit